MIKRGVYQVKGVKPDEGLMLLSGNASKFKENQPVEIKAYDSISRESRGFYYGVVLRHLEDVTGIKQKDLHDLLRYQCGYVEQALTTNGYIEVLKSTDDKSMNQAQYSKFIDTVWNRLTIQGLRIDRETVILPQDLHLDKMIDGYEKIKAIRKYKED
jgi:hypothetical protein